MKKITFILSLFACTFAFAQNGGDDCASAVVITEGSFTDTTINGDGTTNNGDDAWFSFTPASSGTMTISVCADPDQPDTRLFTFTDGCATLTPAGNDDDGCPGGSFASDLSTPVTGGVEYLIQWDDRWSEDPFDWELAVVPPLANDECTGAIPISCGGMATGSTSAATDSGGNAAPDVWYSFTTNILEDVTVSLCGSTYDTAIRVFSDCPATNEVLFNDDSCGLQSEGTFTADGTGGGATYYIMVEGFGTSAGDFTLNVSCIPNVPAPPNDLCANAEPLTLDLMASGTTAGATDDSTGATDDTTCEGFSFKSDVWYTFVAADTDVSIVTQITGDSDQASVAVYSSTDCSQLDADSIACSAGNGGEALDVTGLTGGNTYYVRVWSDGVALANINNGGTNNRIEGTFNITINDALLSAGSFEVNGFEYFPNPVNDNLSLRAQDNIQNVSVYNMLGQEVSRMTPNAVSSEVNMSNLSQGAYFVKVTINGTTETIRVLKK